MKNQKLITIGQLSKITEVSIKSLRYYDKIGILPPKYVDPETSYRYYSFQQARSVAIIQFCIEIGIPLKRFPEFLVEDSQSIQFSKLLDEGTSLATEKIEKIEEKLLLFKEMQNDIGRSESFGSGAAFQNFFMKEHDYWLQEYDGPQEGTQYHVATNKLFEEILQLSIEPGYEFGKMLWFDAEKWKSFLFLEVAVDEEERKKRSNIVHFPAGNYLCTSAETDNLMEAPRIFANHLENVKQRVIFEIEMFSGVYNTEEPKFEWCCSEQMEFDFSEIE